MLEWNHEYDIVNALKSIAESLEYFVAKDRSNDGDN